MVNGGAKTASALASCSIKRHVMLVVLTTACIVIVDLVWLPSSRLYIRYDDVMLALQAFCVLAIAFGAIAIVTRRLRGDTSRAAAAIRRTATKANAILSVMSLNVPFGISFGIFVCLAFAADRPFVDAQLAAIDQSLGFDWLLFLNWTNESDTLSSALTVGYHALGMQTVAVTIWLALANRLDRLFEMNAAVVLSLATCGIAALAFPAAGAYAYFEPSVEMFNNFSANAGMWHFEELMRLRSGEPAAILLSDPKPLITFPSFHTALGLLVTYSLRGSGLIIPIAALNATMIVGTLPEGGHHLIDVIAGALVAVMSVAAVRFVANFEPRVSMARAKTASMANRYRWQTASMQRIDQ